MTPRPDLRFWGLLRLFIGLKLNKVWPYGGCLVIWGPVKGHRHWREARRP